MVRQSAPVRERHTDHRAQPLPIAARSFEFEGQPMAGIRRDIAVELGGTVQDRHHGIDPSVVIEVGERRSVVQAGF